MPAPPPLMIKKINPSPPPGRRGGWGDRIIDFMVWLFERVFDSLIAPILDAIGEAIDNFFQNIVNQMRPALVPFLDRLDSIEGLPPEVRNVTSSLRGTDPITLTAVIGALVVAAVVGAVMGMAQPIMRLLSQEVDSYAHSARMTPSEAYTALRREAISPGDYHNHLSDGGWSEKLEGVWQDILTKRLPDSDLARAVWRDLITPDEMRVELKKRGYANEDIDHIMGLTEVIPPVPDLVRMAVREAWRDDIARLYGYDEDFPADFAVWSEKQGLSREWATRYWRAHWTLPGPVMGREMLHRTDMSESDYDNLLKIADYPKAFRNWMSEVAYAPYTRVDARRMHKLGILKVEDGSLKRAYTDLGYDSEKADNMVLFTVMLNSETERDLTKTDIGNGYESGYFSPKEHDDLLISLGYDKAECEYYRYKIDYKLWKATVKETVKYIEQRYILGQIDQADAYAEMGKLLLPADQMNRNILAWDVKKKAKVKRLTADRLVKFRTQRVITDDEFETEMSGLGYNKKYIGWYLESIKKGK